MKLEDVDLPDYEKIIQELNELLELTDWKSYPRIENIPNETKDLIQRYFLNNVCKLPHIIKPNFDISNQMFFRVRVAESNFNENLISEYGAPPVSLSGQFQRANIPYHPVFYCSFDPQTSINETLSSKMDKISEINIYLSQWRFKENVQLNAEFYTEKNFHSNVNEIRLIEWANSSISKKLDTMADHKKFFLKLRKITCNLFVKKHTHIFSSYLAHNTLYLKSNDRAKLLFYPSIQTDNKSLNIAIHPNTVIESMYLEKVYKLKVAINSDKKIYSFNFQHVGHNINSIFNWNEILKNNYNILLKDILPFFKSNSDK